MNFDGDETSLLRSVVRKGLGSIPTSSALVLNMVQFSMLRNFLWQREDEPQNMLTYVFLIVNLAYGVAFTLFPNSEQVSTSAISLALFPPFIWGLLCLWLVAMTVWGILSRKRIIGGSIGLPGVMVWSYAFTLSLLSSQFLMAFAIFFPQILFWTFWHIGVMRYFSKEEKPAATS